MDGEIYTDPDQKYSIEILTGDVKGSQTWSETIVHGSVSNVIYKGYGNSSTQISSQVNTRHRFYLVTDSKYEIELDTTGLNFNVRDGHRVSAVWGGQSKDKERKLKFLYNYNTRNEVEVKQDRFRSYLQRETIKPSTSAAISLFFCEILIIPIAFLVVGLFSSPLIWLFTEVLKIPLLSTVFLGAISIFSFALSVLIIYVISRIVWSKLLSYAHKWINEHNRIHEWLTETLSNCIARETQRLENLNQGSTS